MKRPNIPVDIRSQVLHEAAYQCSNPICRTLITLDLHHIDKVSKNGKTTPENLIALCPNCHRRFHTGEFPESTIRSWKYHLLALNEAYDKKSINYLLLLNKAGELFLRSEGLLEVAGLIASGNVLFEEERRETLLEVNRFRGQAIPTLENGYKISLSPKGKDLIEGWINGKQLSTDI